MMNGLLFGRLTLPLVAASTLPTAAGRQKAPVDAAKRRNSDDLPAPSNADAREASGFVTDFLLIDKKKISIQKARLTATPAGDNNISAELETPQGIVRLAYDIKPGDEGSQGEVSRVQFFFRQARGQKTTLALSEPLDNDCFRHLNLRLGKAESPTLNFTGLLGFARAQRLSRQLERWLQKMDPVIREFRGLQEVAAAPEPQD